MLTLLGVFTEKVGKAAISYIVLKMFHSWVKVP